MYTTNSDYLQMLIKTHGTEERPSFYVMCFPSAKWTMVGAQPRFPQDAGRSLWAGSAAGAVACSWGEAQTKLSEAVWSLLASAKFTSFSVVLSSYKELNL